MGDVKQDIAGDGAAAGIRVRDVLTRADRVLVVAVALLIALLWMGGPGEAGGELQIEAAGDLAIRQALADDAVLDVAGAIGTSRVQIKNGRARFVEGPCRHLLCVRQGWLDRRGQVAVCLPNRVAIEVLGRGDGPDAVTH